MLENLSDTARPASAWTSSLRLFRNPDRLSDVFVLEQALIDRSTLARMRARVGGHPEGARAIATRRRLGVVTTESMREAPAGSVGAAYVRHLEGHGLDPDAIPTRPAGDDLEYIDAHLYETHDLWHVATGFGADVAGELGLQAFYLAQLPGRLAPLLILGGLVNAVLWERRDFVRRMRAVIRGFSMGRRARPLFGIDWRAHLHEPLHAFRASLGLPVEGAFGQAPESPSLLRYAPTSIPCASSQR